MRCLANYSFFNASAGLVRAAHTAIGTAMTQGSAPKRECFLGEGHREAFFLFDFSVHCVFHGIK